MPADAASPLKRLSDLGQSVWVDYLSRESIRGGHLQELIDEDSVVGATSNPTIFAKAMSSGNAYDEQLHELADRNPTHPANLEQSFWALAQQDIKDACDVFRPVWERSGRRDGYVSLEVDPRLAYETLQTFREAMHLHQTVDRPNLMVKIPATRPGLAAIEDVIAKGHSINVTLIFSLQRYAEVAESYIRGIERLVAEGGDPRAVASVASFFVSRIDTEADKRLEALDAPQINLCQPLRRDLPFLDPARKLCDSSKRNILFIRRQRSPAVLAAHKHIRRRIALHPRQLRIPQRRRSQRRLQRQLARPGPSLV